jgi:hypothetical protein
MKLEKSDLQLETIVSRITAEELDLQPNFQRGEIWDIKRRQRLIDTILREWYVPAIHIVVDSDGEEVVLDGQQRLAAIRDFFADRFRVDGTIEPHDESIASLGNLRYSTLPPAVRRAVNRFVLPVITLSDHLPQEPNELFFRLNQSYNLTPPEKRNALHGEARDQVKQLVEVLAGIGLLESGRVGFTNGRLAYDDIVARTCVAIEAGTLRQHINNNVVENFYRSQTFSPETIRGVERAGRELLSQIETSGLRIKFNKGTLQSWLLYCFWAPVTTESLPQGLLKEFEINRSIIRGGGYISPGGPSRAMTEIIRMYDDRASYRVTDVSSVLIRDLAIHLFSSGVFGTSPRKSSNDLIATMDLEPLAVQSLVADYLEQSRWGEPIAEMGSGL